MIYFFYPSDIVGGAEYLMINSANLLSEAGCEVGIVDFKGGWVVDNISNCLIKKKYITAKEKLFLNENDVLITTSNNFYKLDNYFFESKAKVLFWTVQPYNVVLGIPVFFNRSGFFKKILLNYVNSKKIQHKNNLELVLNKKGMVSMDGECNRILKLNYDLTYSGFLPVFYKEKNNVELTINEINSNDIKVVWLGRIDMDFKIHILKKVLLDIDLIKEDLGNQVVFNIIGNGPGLEELKKFVRLKINYQVNFLNELKGNCLSNALKENHIGFAMGTSALDIAAVKVPTVLLDFSYNEIVDYNYRWLFESNDHILGRDIKLLSTNEIKSMKSLLLIFQELRENPLKIKEQCFEYLNENHSSADMARRILNFLSNTELTLHDIYQYRTTKPIWNKISHLLRKFRK